MNLSAELIGVLAAIFLGWGGWISNAVIRNQKDLTNLKASNINIHNDMEGLKDGFVELKNDIKEQFKQMNTKFDIFLRDEISFLKDLARK